MEQPENGSDIEPEASGVPDYVVDDDPDLRERIGVHLAGVRKSRKLSQEVVAKHVGLSRPHLSNIELGRSRAGWSGLTRMAAYYDLNIRELINEVGGRSVAPGVVGGSFGKSASVEAGEPPFGSNFTDYERFVLNGLHHLSAAERQRYMSDILAAIQRRLISVKS